MKQWGGGGTVDAPDRRQNRRPTRPTTDTYRFSQTLIQSVSTQYTVEFEEPNELTDDDETTVVVDDYDDFGSSYSFHLPDGTVRSFGKQLVETVEPAE
jgi:hypothetical protein